MRCEYVIETAKGAPIKSFDLRAKAIEYATDIAATFPDCTVVQVIHHEPTRAVVFTPGGQRARLQLVAS